VKIFDKYNQLLTTQKILKNKLRPITCRYITLPYSFGQLTFRLAIISFRHDRKAALDLQRKNNKTVKFQIDYPAPFDISSIFYSSTSDSALPI